MIIVLCLIYKRGDDFVWTKLLKGICVEIILRGFMKDREIAEKLIGNKIFIARETEADDGFVRLTEAVITSYFSLKDENQKIALIAREINDKPILVQKPVHLHFIVKD